MAYENGRPINRHANIMEHQRKLHQRFSKSVFNCRQFYEREEEARQRNLDNLYGVYELEQTRRDNGHRPWYLRYWRLNGSHVKKNVKHYQHRATRHYYNEQLKVIDVEVGINKVPDNRLIDMWFWD